MSSLITDAITTAATGTAAAWTSADTVLEAGEMGYETDTGKAKIGDGTTAWTSLDYAIIPTGLVTAERYNTGWVANSDWTNLQATITHSLNANLSDLTVKFLISTDGTDDNSFSIDLTTVLVYTTGTFDASYGVNIYQIDSNGVTIQTGADGIEYLVSTTGVRGLIDTESWYYKVVVTKLTIQ